MLVNNFIVCVIQIVKCTTIYGMGNSTKRLASAVGWALFSVWLRHSAEGPCKSLQLQLAQSLQISCFGPNIFQAFFMGDWGHYYFSVVGQYCWKNLDPILIVYHNLCSSLGCYSKVLSQLPPRSLFSHCVTVVPCLAMLIRAAKIAAKQFHL